MDDSDGGRQQPAVDCSECPAVVFPKMTDESETRITAADVLQCYREEILLEFLDLPLDDVNQRGISETVRSTSPRFAETWLTSGR
jgi:hypothetical protein